MTQTEGRLNTRIGEYDFIVRSIPVYPQNDLDVPIGKQVLIKIRAPFGEKLSGRIMTKLFDSEKVFTMKLKIENNEGCVQFITKGQEIVKLRNDKAIGVLDLRSVGYFKVNYQKMITMAESRQTFKMYHYQQVRKEPKEQVRKESKEHINEYFRMSHINSNRESTYSTKGNPDKYPWLAEDDPRRHQTDAEILYEKIDLKESALSKKEKANEKVNENDTEVQRCFKSKK